MGKFKANRAGYAALMNSAQVQSVIEGKADAVKEAADSALSEGGYNGKLKLLFYDPETGERAIVDTDIPCTVTVEK